jgi:IstB-like ATP binding protein
VWEASREQLLVLVAAQGKRASLIVTSSKPFCRWGEVFGDVVAAAVIDRLVHHAEVVALKGDSYRLKTETSDASPPRPTNDDNPASAQLSRPLTRGRTIWLKPEGRIATRSLRAWPLQQRTL